MEIINNRGVWLDYEICAAAAYHAVPKDKACLLAYKNKGYFRTAHESDLILYEAAAKVIGFALIGGRVPSVAALQAEYAKLNEQKEALYADCVKFKKQVKGYDKMKRNINDFLKIDRGQSKKKLRQENNFIKFCVFMFFVRYNPL